MRSGEVCGRDFPYQRTADPAEGASGLMEAYPLVEVSVLEGNTRELAEALLNGDVDMTVGPVPRSIRI